MNIILPELGEGIDNVEVTDVIVKKGEQVKIEDVLLVVESDKASMEIPSEKSGTILKVLISKGETEFSLKRKVLKQEHKLFSQSIISLFR